MPSASRYSSQNPASFRACRLPNPVSLRQPTNPTFANGLPRLLRGWGPHHYNCTSRLQTQDPLRAMSRQRRKLIYLLGFMGSGKSTVGGLLANALGWPLIDLDTVIEAGHGLSIRQIFETSGEPFFRQVEHAALTEASKTDSAVIALGGGTFAQPSNVDIIRESGRDGRRCGSTALPKSCVPGAKGWRIGRCFAMSSRLPSSSRTVFPITGWQISGSPPRAASRKKWSNRY